MKMISSLLLRVWFPISNGGYLLTWLKVESISTRQSQSGRSFRLIARENGRELLRSLPSISRPLWPLGISKQGTAGGGGMPAGGGKGYLCFDANRLWKVFGIPAPCSRCSRQGGISGFSERLSLSHFWRWPSLSAPSLHWSRTRWSIWLEETYWLSPSTQSWVREIVKGCWTILGRGRHQRSCCMSPRNNVEQGPSPMFWTIWCSTQSWHTLWLMRLTVWVSGDMTSGEASSVLGVRHNSQQPLLCQARLSKVGTIETSDRISPLGSFNCHCRFFPILSVFWYNYWIWRKNLGRPLLLLLKTLCPVSNWARTTRPSSCPASGRTFSMMCSSRMHWRMKWST